MRTYLNIINLYGIKPILLLEVTVVETLEALTVTSLVLCHLMNSVVDSVEILSLGVLCDTELVSTSTALSCHTLLKVGLSVPNNVAQELSKLRSVLSLLKSVAFESLSNLWITLAVSLTAHCKIHTNLSALTVEVVLK